jgi:hypothetical protein
MLSLLIGLLGAPGGALRAQAAGEARLGEPIELRAGPDSPPSLVAAPAPVRRSPSLAAGGATFIITYSGFSPEAQAAFQAAADIWASQISSPVPIRVSASWTPLGPGILGSARAHSVFRNFAGAPLASTWYPSALANKLAGADLDPAAVDIDASFSSAFPNWYFGADGRTPNGQYDLETVVLHELGHGLGFFGSAAYSGGTGSWGARSDSPYIYDRFVTDGDGQPLTNTALYPNSSAALGNLLISGNLFLSSASTTAAASASPRLYAPSPWQPGSSYSHLDENTYPAGDINSLMTPQLGRGEAILNPGPITLALLNELGWGAASAPNTAPSDTATSTATDTPTVTATTTPTDTPTSTPTATPTSTPTATPTDPPASTPTEAPTSTQAPSGAPPGWRVFLPLARH